jgi:type IV pilus assembly protein PilY1
MKMTEQTKVINNRLTGISRLGDRMKQCAIISIALLVTSVPVTVKSGDLVLANSPLFLENNVQPNIFFMLDDSGSMDWEVLMTESAVALHAGNPNSGDVDLTPDNEAERLELCLSYNALAFNPAVTVVAGVNTYKYKGIENVWKGKDSAGVDYAEMTTYSAVRNNPYNPAGTFDLTAAGIIAYFPWTDTNLNGVYDVGECGANISADNSDGVTFASLSANQKLNFANWYSYYRKRDYVMKYAMGEVIFPSQHRMGLGTLWNRNSVGTPIKDVDNLSIPLNATAVTNKAALLDNVSKITPGNTTPLRQKLQDAGEYYDGTGNSALFGATYTHAGTFNSTSPIFNAAKGGECQQNFTFLMTDGFWNGGNPNPLVGNTDTNTPVTASPYDGDPYEDAFSNTLADVAMEYYENDLALTLADKVPTTTIDTNDMQHMVTYTIAFGLKGEISETYSGDNPAEGAFPGWPDPFSGNTDKRRIDDVWHAAFNSRGLYLNASNPSDLVAEFNKVLKSINARAGSIPQCIEPI